MSCLSKVGKDVTFCCTKKDGLKLCVINEASTAFATFSFAPQFFETFRVSVGTVAIAALAAAAAAGRKRGKLGAASDRD